MKPKVYVETTVLSYLAARLSRDPNYANEPFENIDPAGVALTYVPVCRLSWKWRERSAVKITQRAREKDTEAFHGYGLDRIYADLKKREASSLLRRVEERRP